MKKKKILVVDDEVGIREVLSRMLKSHDYEVICAKDGEECLLKVAEEMPDLIILDVMMPKIYGGGVLNALKGKKILSEEADKIANIPVIVLTARIDIDVKEWFMKRDVQGYILKPFNISDLLANIAGCLKPREDFMAKMTEALYKKLQQEEA